MDLNDLLGSVVFTVSCLGFRALGFRVSGLGFGVSGLGLRVWGP